MAVNISSRRKKRETIIKEFGEVEIIDVTSKGEDPWVKFSPFYPHGNIPVPMSDVTAQSVEGIWQALKVFETEDVDLSKLDVANMKGIKRTVRKYGQCLGHRDGAFGKNLLGYLDARINIYIPAYQWVLENCLKPEIELLKSKSELGVVLLDYETNGDIQDLSKPLSHAHLVKKFIDRGQLLP